MFLICAARQGEPVDQRRGGVLPGQPHQAAETLQVHRDLCHHAGATIVLDLRRTSSL